MVKLVALRSPRPQDQTCVWMNAGLLAYKLCDRNFDCEHCPLDAALRGDAGASRHDAPTHLSVTYPDDRLYTKGHTWLRSAGGSEDPMRFGIDAFAALFVGTTRHLRWRPVPNPIGAGQTICVLELGDGDMPLGMPVPGSVVRWNEAVRERPESLVEDPYGEGWIVELHAHSRDELDALLRSEDVRRQTRLDVRRFRRHVGFELLLRGDGADASTTLDNDTVTDLRGMLGGSTFLALARDLIH